MTELLDFLHARLTDDEQAALATIGINERVDMKRGKPAPHWLPEPGSSGICDENGIRRVAHTWVREREHIVRHDPARVLAEVEAKRRIIEEFRWWWDGGPSEPESDSELHARRAHPAYEYATTEGQRKDFDDADVPPYGDDGEPDRTWERNIDAGRDGWERFDYTEESYWRRRLPDEEIARREKQRNRPPAVLALLALPYASHPDYREEWRP